MNTIAIIPGSFNPVHIGHIHLANECINKYDFDEVRFVPAYQNPWKPPYELSFEQRCKLVEMQIASDETWEFVRHKKWFQNNVSVWDIEKYVHQNARMMVSESVVYFIDTIRSIHEYFDGFDDVTHISLIFGEDILAEFHKWKYFDQITNYCDIIFIKKHVEENMIITSSDIRKAIKEGKKPNGLSADVYGQIKEWGVYA